MITNEARARGVIAEVFPNGAIAKADAAHLRESIVQAIADALIDYAAVQEIKVAALHRAYQDMLSGRMAFVPQSKET